MNCVAGIGRLGLPLLLNFADRTSSSWIGYDVNETYVSDLSKGVYASTEAGVNDLLSETKASFTSDPEVLKACEHIILCVRTDSVENGEYDVSNVFDFVEVLKEQLGNCEAVGLESLVINCNVNPGTSLLVEEALKDFDVTVIFWPEWVKQGAIVEDQLNPPVQIFGASAWSTSTENTIALLASLNTNPDNTPVERMTLMEAEATKLVLNCYLTVKISYANMVGRLFNDLGLRGEIILRACGHDPRIGNSFFRPGEPFGGPCFPRDIRAFKAFADSFGCELPVIDAAEKVNKLERQLLLKNKFKQAVDKGEANFESLDFKKGTYIFSGSPNLEAAINLDRFGLKVNVEEEYRDQLSQLND